MPLTTAAPVGFIPTNNPEAARRFYETVLGLELSYDDGFAMVFHLGSSGLTLRVVRVGTFTPQAFTIYGWEVEDLPSVVKELTGKGASFVQFDGLEQDERGIWTAPSGNRIAWFRDPDGNVLSLAHHGD